MEQRVIPLQSRGVGRIPDGHQLRRIEGKYHHRQDGDVQKCEAERDASDDEIRTAIIHRAPADSRACTLWYHIMNGTRMANNKIATALATGHARLEKNSSHSTRPIISAFGPPSSAGITNSPTAGMNTNMEPASMPLRDNGSVIFRNACHGRQPRSSAASSNCQSIFSRLAYSGNTKKGKYE